ncbi:hypothetical protein LWI29_000804 [Acer saccharum]|uniref:Uncharacterized protein n=1 Tax=Acer saccharum TaxID=4024 RepID=A0AA39S569_ACESA|nr:hypothetical protein LWI29_000804 [Acer saccharum]
MSVDDSPIKEIYVDEFKRVDGSGDGKLHKPLGRCIHWANNCQEIGYVPRASQHSKKTSSSKRKSGSLSAAADDADQDEISHDQESFEYNEAQQNLLPRGRISKRIRTSLSMKKGSSEMRRRQD